MENRFNEVVEEGENFFELGKYNDCIEMFSEAIAFARLLNREKLLIKLMIKRADSYYHKGDYKRVIKHCNRLAVYADQMDEEDLIDYHEIRAISLAQIGNYEEAIEEYQKLISCSSDTAQFKAYTGLGLVYYHQARYNQQSAKYNTALFYYEKALKHTDNDSRNITMILHNIGMVYYEKGYYQKALSRYIESLRFQIKKYYPYSYNEIAKVYIRLENLDKANEYINKAATILTLPSQKNHIEIARNFFVKGLYYKTLKDYETSIFFFKLALNEFKDREILAEVSEIYSELSRIYKEINPELAMDYLAESRVYHKMIK